MDEKTIIEFLDRKKNRQTNRKVDYGINNNQARMSNEDVIDEVIELDDDLIYDPAFAALLNEEREIVIAEDRYKYTEMGLFKVENDNEAILDTYLSNLTVDQRLAFIKPAPTVDMPCYNISYQPTILNVADGIELYQPPIVSSCQPTWMPPVSNVSVPPVLESSQNRVKATLPICEGPEESLWDKLFGKTKNCYTAYPDGRRLKNSFWNQNYLLFSSLGCKAKFQKRKCVQVVFRSSICFWDKSFPEQIELGVNSVKYDYVYNVPQFNSQAYQYATTFFSYNGTNWDSSGRVINTVPTGKGSFILDSQSNYKGILNIYVLGNHISDANYNLAIDELAKLAIQKAPGWLGIEIKNKDDADQLKFHVLNSVPFDNKVTFIVSNLEWTGTDNSIVHYFDFNFLITWNSNMSGFGDYLNGLNGATSYKNIEADIYGTAKYAGKWDGNRLKYR